MSVVIIFLFAVKYEKIKFLVVALRDSVGIYAWAPRPYHKFMDFKVRYLSSDVEKRLSYTPISYSLLRMYVSGQFASC